MISSLNITWKDDEAREGEMQILYSVGVMFGLWKMSEFKKSTVQHSVYS